MNNQTEEISWSESWELMKRGVRVWWKFYPEALISRGMYETVTAVFPYVDIYLSARIINELAGKRSPEVLKQLVLITIFVNALMALVKAALERWKDVVETENDFMFQKIYDEKLVSMDFSKFDTAKTHQLLNQILQIDGYMEMGLREIMYIFESMCRNVFKIIGAVSLSVSLFTHKVPVEGGNLVVLNSPWVAAVVAGMIGVVIVLAPKLEMKANEHWEKSLLDGTQGNRNFSFFGYRILEKKRALDVRMYEQEKIAVDMFMQNKTFMPDGKMAKMMRGRVGLFHVASRAVSYVTTGIVYIFVCLKAWGGAFGVGSVTQYVGATTALAQGISGLIADIGAQKTNAGCLRQTFEFLDIPNEMYQGSLTIEKRSDRNYVVEFKDVSFKYPDSDVWSLRHVNMKFKVGEKLAIVGQNGSGKTTFIKLLCRLYDPTEGEILLNGIDIRKYNYQEYMSIFSIVFQDFQLLAFPLGENVAVSRDVDNNRAEKKLKDAGFESLMEKMPKGLDTYLYKEFDESGVDVSGGEAQKIAIARALYKDAPFIVLDEPTAALDPIAEAEIYSKFNDIVEDKTAIYISHRLSSCKFCDEIAVFDAGSVIQQGTHENLVEDESGKYYELWNAQAQYYA